VTQSIPIITDAHAHLPDHNPQDDPRQDQQQQQQQSAKKNPSNGAPRGKGEAS